MQVSQARVTAGENERPTKKARLSSNALSKWDEFASEVEAAKRTVDVSTQGFAFEFVEGALVKALRTGQWLLLDEINMAPPQVCANVLSVSHIRSQVCSTGPLVHCRSTMLWRL
jgi:midasin